ncbi:malto-oligosyltrehalose synthase [Granulibacter bethesdensis]|uniref:(1->4)-alpha-D-glucan 1-alpha-D-glucosylmutase n=1 Tax=Granulibacter bethesdensis (strain ATCC BAA-1260 / CGDNIH1) TaxID=391165 RepID=Q0BU57_GRABC|nr:malto-oligosyltrehalose synthase [Granulibacter bethesdensis]ABI61645.1 (1->4)-alpha-D-glucan 1-alpha-D-glucosylmutase [Granulibacter bethesdensis CGDNIH1]APH51450.1 (1->4)-alpha-D-glucan 1-alpha-D-glucosylmutase [Granulibacter bethesdensis]APH64143.1 (1->4)-alpha-D-glucan 1-alpha-D-glucosylmutase [Granulibacter bethesdensis]
MSISATARLQFHKDFTLADGTKLVPYLASLGISHLYASPLLKARPGSTHGYDIVDHTQLNPEIGDEAALQTMVAALRQHDMGLILDIVPNHMGVGGTDNLWWLDVLEWGRSSPYAEFFDIDWDPPDSSLRGRILAPFLGSPYGDALDQGDITLHFDDQDGRLFISCYGSHRFPVTPREYVTILSAEGGRLEEIARDIAELPAGRDSTRRQVEDLRQQLREPSLRSGIDHALRAFDPHQPAGRERLHRLLERQHYRLSFWRAASDEINWRRFFDINGLAGVRVEVPHVFDATHEYTLSLYTRGLIDGLRIDHVDGLADPRGYCRKLRRRLEAATESRPVELRHIKPVIWVEKILAPHEKLPADWLTDGTTGYDFMSQVSALLHDPYGEAPLTHFWTSLTHRPGDFEDEAKAARRQILRESLSSETFATAAALHRLARRDPHTRDYTLTAIRRVLVEILVHFHVYRIYAGLGGMAESDERELDWAIAGARKTVRSADIGLLDLVGRWLAGSGLRQVPAGPRRQEWLRAMVRFQQLSAPTNAKSVEDTAFYRYGRLLSRNEVGAEPQQFALTPAAFHAANTDRRKRWHRGLLATATHDHKRGEDTRARIAVLSELPEIWENAVMRWSRLNAPLRREIEHHPAPDEADEAMLYQMLIGAWPFGLSPDNREGMAIFIERIAAWQEKALREAKRHSEWAAPDEAYESACRSFLSDLLNPDRPAKVAQDMAAFASGIMAAGACNSLSQTLLKATSPGIPDLYQGAEFWDFSLVDPDNRRPVDFPSRMAALQDENKAEAASLAGHWHDGHIKQAILAAALRLRRRAPGLFEAGTYLPLKVEGPQSGHILAFVRAHEGRAALTAVTRLTVRLRNEDDFSSSPAQPHSGSNGSLPLAEQTQSELWTVPATSWKGTFIHVPRQFQGRKVKNLLDGMETNALPARIRAEDLFNILPVALLEAG